MYYEGLKRKNEAKQKELQLDLQKVIVGKTTLRTLFKKASPQTVIKEIEEQIACLQLDQSDIGQICNFISAILAFVEIDKFKQDKVAKYFVMLGRLSSQEMAYSAHTRHFWSALQQSA